MSTTALQETLTGGADAVPTGVCGRCHRPVIVTVGPDRKRRVLDPQRVAGGLYRLDGQGRAVRRRGYDMAREYQRHELVFGGGLEPHRCRPR